MSTKEERAFRAQNRKPQLNVEATKAEKAYFESIATAQNTKLATLIRRLLHAEGDRIGLVPPSVVDLNGRFGL